MLSFRNLISVSVVLFPFSLSNAAPLPSAQTSSTDAAALKENLFAFSATAISSTLPLTVGENSLPPPTGLTLKYVTVGHGVQNYTCAAQAPNSAPTAIGALATLYDITSLALISPDLASVLPALAAAMPLTSSFIVPGTPLSIKDVGTFPIIGGHFFTADATPVFDLFTSGERIFAKLLKKIKAPAEASQQLEGQSAVDWLALAKKDNTDTVGLTQVFRVDTAGGNPPATCAGIEGVISVPYAAAYHFYA